MDIEIISYHTLLSNDKKIEKLETALFEMGIVGISDIPHFEDISKRYIQAARQFAAFPENIKQQYAPNRDAGITEGYELGAEKFKDNEGRWRVDHQKASFYAFVPDHLKNVWPREVDLKTHYLALGELILKVGKMLLNVIGLNDSIGLSHSSLTGYGRMLHYQKNASSSSHSTWCGAHYDHGLFTGLMPAYYFQDNEEVDEPKDAGLHILPANGQDFSKVNANNKSVLYFQVGEFAQLIMNDRIKATKHYVKQSESGIERFTFALFTNPLNEMIIRSHSCLARDERYTENKNTDNSISYEKWADASYSRYRAK